MKLLLIDDHALFLSGMKHMLEDRLEAAVVLDASSQSAAMEILDTNPDIDLILVDLSMPGTHGLDLIPGLENRNIWCPVAVVSATDKAQEIQAVVDSGAMGFIHKSTSPENMLEAIHTIISGTPWFPGEIMRRLEDAKYHRIGQQLIDHARQYHLGKRQLQVLDLMSQGLSNQQIAETLFIGEPTVKSHVSTLFKALGVSNRTQCVQRAAEERLLPST